MHCDNRSCGASRGAAQLGRAPETCAQVARECSLLYFPISRITNEPLMGVGRGRGFSGVGAAAALKSAVTVKTWPVFESMAMVRVPNWVVMFPTTLYLSAESWWMTETRPSRHAANS